MYLYHSENLSDETTHYVPDASSECKDFNTKSIYNNVSYSFIKNHDSMMSVHDVGEACHRGVSRSVPILFCTVRVNAKKFFEDYGTNMSCVDVFVSHMGYEIIAAVNR